MIITELGVDHPSFRKDIFLRFKYPISIVFLWGIIKSGIQSSTWHGESVVTQIQRKDHQSSSSSYVFSTWLNTLPFKMKNYWKIRKLNNGSFTVEKLPFGELKSPLTEMISNSLDHQNTRYDTLLIYDYINLSHKRKKYCLCEMKENKEHFFSVKYFLNDGNALSKSVSRHIFI